MWHLSAQKGSVRRQTQPLLSALPPATRCHVPPGTATAPFAAARPHQPLPAKLQLPAEALPAARSGKAGPNFQAICRKPAHSQQSPQQPSIQNKVLDEATAGLFATSPRPPQALQLPPNRLEGSKPALPGSDTVGRLFSIQFHAAEFTGVNARSQISKSHTLILHEHWLPNPQPEPRHRACSANASTRHFSPLPDGQDSSGPGYPQGLHATGIKLKHEAKNVLRKPTA